MATIKSIAFGKKGIFFVKNGSSISEEFLIKHDLMIKAIDELINSEECGLHAYRIVQQAVKNIMDSKCVGNGAIIDGKRYNINDSEYYLLYNQYIKDNEKVKRRYKERLNKMKREREIREGNIKTKERAAEFRNENAKQKGQKGQKKQK